MKTKSTREVIGYSWTQRKKGEKWIETFSNTIEVFVDILDRAFEVRPLPSYEFGGCGFM